MQEFTERDRRLLSNIHWSPEQRKLLSDKLSLLTDAINVGGAKGDKGDKGDTGDAGKDGAAGAKGADGKSIKAITLTVDGDGKVTGGTATLSDNSTIAITVTTG